MQQVLLSLIPPSCMVASNVELVNTVFPFDTSTFGSKQHEYGHGYKHSER